jgi:hypothetical protein
VYGVAAVLAFLVYERVVLDTAARWNVASDKYRDALAAARDLANREDEIRALDDTIETVGAVDAPTGEADTAAALGQAVADVLKNHSVSKDSFQTDPIVKLPRADRLRDLFDQGEAQLLTGSLEFESSVEEAVAIIAELETSPEIEAVSSVRLTRLAGQSAGMQKVNVRLKLESWINARPATKPGSARS